MKTIYILLTLLLVSAVNANDLSWVNEQVEAIKPPRQGISEKEISKIKDPFIFLIKNEEEIKDKKTVKKTVRKVRYVKKRYTRRLTLEAVLNKTALINGRWYKEGSRVYGYKLYIINLHSVVLKKNNKKIVLSTKSKSKNLKFKNKK